MAVKYDLPSIAASGDDPLLLDANFRFYEAQPNGDAFVYVELYAVKKESYKTLKKGALSANRSNAYHVKQTNYSDIGGGFVTFERHFAVIPNSWFDYELVSYSRLDVTGDAGLIRSYINPESYVSNGAVAPTGEVTGNQTSTLAKAVRTYYLKDNLPSTLSFYPPFYNIPAGDTLDNKKIKEDSISVYMDPIYVVTSYIAEELK